MCCHSPAGWASPDRPGWRSLSFPQLSRLALAWLMNCDGTQLQGCLWGFCCYQKAGQSKQECETLLNSADGSQPSYQLARVTHSAEHLKDPHCQDVRVAGCTASCWWYKKKSVNNVTNLPRHALPYTTQIESVVWLQENGPLELPGNLRHRSNVGQRLWGNLCEEIAILFKPFPSLISQCTLTFKSKLALNCFFGGYSLYTTEKVFLCAREVLILCRFFSSQQVRNKSLYFQELLNFCWKGIQQHCKRSTCLGHGAAATIAISEAVVHVSRELDKTP